MSTGLALLIAGAAMLTGIVAGGTAPRIWRAATLVGLGAAFAAAVALLAGGADWLWSGGFLLGGERVALRLDAISALFLALLCVVGAAVAVYAGDYWADHDHPRSARSGRVWWNVMLLNLGLVLLSANGLHFLIAWELFTLAAYFLITLNRQRPAIRAAGWLYLAASHAAVLALVAAGQGNAAWGRLALAGGLLHCWNHGLFKGLLFLGAGSVLHAAGTREMSRLGGLWRALPWTAGLFALGAAAICGLPPLNGFVSEWLVFLGLFDATLTRGPAAWNGAWAGSEVPAPLVQLGLVYLRLAGVALAAGFCLWRRVRARAFTRAPTWDCGYVAPTARMQYTAGSFAGTITEWFAFILRPLRHAHLPEGFFPASASLVEHTPETVLEQVVAPAGRAVLRLSALARRLQHGRVQFYVLYVLLGVLVLAAWVLARGSPLAVAEHPGHSDSARSGDGSGFARGIPRVLPKR